ncbi:MAG: NAD-dependent DNA ligase LigA [Candidatus Staskawiczbacteria bacterium]|nr:NAD-dependent DNA ligase LigA [Candidatus Staskawiczbacteria bacterium]
MNKQEAKNRIEKLREVINHHRYLYHVLDKQEISDSALDSLKKELFDLEQEFPDLITSDSPTQRIGDKALKEFKKVKHLQRMTSFNDAFSKEDMQDWQERFMKLLTEKEKQEVNFYCELKIDGLAIELIYKNGFLQTGSTRGDGNIGEDITQNLKTVEAIPLRVIPAKAGIQIPEQLIVRGEVFISKKEFERINKEQQEKGLAVYANPRNIAAGSVRQLDPKITSGRKLDSFAYELLTNFGQITHEDKHKILKDLGFKTNKHNKYCKSLEEVLQFREHWIKEREKLDYEIDGVVVLINNNEIFEKLGIVGKAPRGGIAFKFPQAQSTTKVLDIKVQVGRTGAMTPVAILEPVQVTGITITRATLHNEDEIKRLGLKIGDTVIVGRAGDVIPDIIKVLPELRTGKEKSFNMPEKCPSCGAKLVKMEGEVLLRCPNKNCFAQKRRNFYHFVSRTAFNIDGLGPKIIDKLIDAGLVSDPADLFDLKEGDILVGEKGLPRRMMGFAEKSAENLIKSIQEKREITLAKFIYALGIRNIGEETAIDLAKHFGSIKKIREAKLEDFDSISDIGPVVSKSVYEWFANKENKKYLDKLEKRVKIHSMVGRGAPSDDGAKLSGKTFVLTGSLETMSRNDAKAKIREFGGDVSESVSSKTSYAVVGLDPGSKAERARKLGVKILSEQEFMKLVE